MTRLPHASLHRVTIRWQGRSVEARAGEPVAASLYAAGIRILARSRKFHRPRGLSGSFTAGVLARVDGAPNVRLDVVPVRDGLEAHAQNVWPDQRFDLLRAARLLPRRWLRAGFEHPRWPPSGTRAFDAWECLLRFAAGVAAPPDPAAGTEIVAGERLSADTVVIGGGPAGRAAAAEAAGLGQAVLLIARTVGDGFAASMGRSLPPVPPQVRVLAGYEAFGLYRHATLVGCAPSLGGPAVVIDARRILLCTGRRSTPPLVPGIDLPGVLDVRAAMKLARVCGVAPGRRVVLVGTGDLTPVAVRFRELGVNVVAVAPAADLRRVVGFSSIRSVDIADERIGCDALVHAGPWRPDPTLPFQAGAEGEFRLKARQLPSHVSIMGAAAEEPEPVVFGERLDDRALVCPCMDVTVAEVRALLRGGESNVEVIKRLTGCGMGPCQGVPCWDLLAAALAAITGWPESAVGHPSYRAPRGALTLGQAAGLAGLVAPESDP